MKKTLTRSSVSRYTGMSSALRSGLALSAVVVAALALAAPASAGYVRQGAGDIDFFYFADNGEANSLLVSQLDGLVYFVEREGLAIDNRAGLFPCFAPRENNVVGCAYSGELKVQVVLQDRDDRALFHKEQSLTSPTKVILHGGNGSDDLKVGGERDELAATDVELSGGDGDSARDILIATGVSGGIVRMKGGAGDDSLSNQMSSSKGFLDGGRGGDRIVGGHSADVLTGDEGDDSIRGGDGEDQISGGAGNDRLGSAADRRGDPRTERGRDTIEGGSGDDNLAGGFGSDILKAGTGDDALGVGAPLFRRRKVLDEPGADGFDAGAGNDRIGGGSGTDILSGGQGRDVMDGGSDRDLLLAADHQRDGTLDCGSQSDRLRVDTKDRPRRRPTSKNDPFQTSIRNCEKVEVTK